MEKATIDVSVPQPLIQFNKEETVTSNGMYTISPSSGYDAMNNATVNVNVPNEVSEGTFTSNGTYTPFSPYIGFSSVTVDVPNSTTTKTITSNGTYSPFPPIIGYHQVKVNVPNSTTTKTITSNGTYTPSSSYIGFSSVTVNVPSSTPPIANNLKYMDNNNNTQTVLIRNFQKTTSAIDWSIGGGNLLIVLSKTSYGMDITFSYNNTNQSIYKQIGSNKYYHYISGNGNKPYIYGNNITFYNSNNQDLLELRIEKGGASGVANVIDNYYYIRDTLMTFNLPTS